jgi:hypothetical protein
MPEIISDTNFTPWDSPEYERDEHGNIKIYDPEPEALDAYHESPYYAGHRYQNPPPFNYSLPKPLIVELMEIKELLEQILTKL